MLEENIKLWDTEIKIIQSEPQRESSSDINEKRAASHGFCSLIDVSLDSQREGKEKRVCEAKTAPYIF